MSGEYASPEWVDIPNLTIKFDIAEGQPDSYGWSVSGAIPLMELIGYVGKVQRQLQEVGKERWEEIAERILVIQWFAEHKKFGWYTHPDTPVNAMCGMLEMLKQTLGHDYQSQAEHAGGGEES